MAKRPAPQREDAGAVAPAEAQAAEPAVESREVRDAEPAPAEAQAAEPDNANADVQEFASRVADTAVRVRDALKALQEIPPALVPTSRTRCINCGEPGRVTFDGRFRCAACGHAWDAAEEQSPFRRMQRGER